MTSPSPTAPEPGTVTVIVVMGVAGSGKTTIGTALAVALGWRFVDADDHHAAASIAKMARGEPLDDADRWPWLDRLHEIIAEALASNAGLVLACSALKASYRARLASDDASGRVRFVYLAGTAELFRGRLVQRPGHFMKPAMLDSQLTTLEPPPDALSVDAALPVATLVLRIRNAFLLQR